jgi:predicted metalloprotease with PDZ domain
MPPEKLTKLVRAIQEMAGVPLPGGGVRTVIVLPSGFMNGGAAGGRSVVQAPLVNVIAHEMLHWWIHNGLGGPETRWFTEGFNDYFSLKAADKSGAWGNSARDACISDLQAEMRFLEKDNAVSLAEASQSYRSNPKLKRVVYSKGHLFALFLDRKLNQEGRDLEEVLPLLLSDRRSSLTNHELENALSKVFGDSISTQLNAYVFDAKRLPESGLPAGDGTSGCARFLPSR